MGCGVSSDNLNIIDSTSTSRSSMIVNNNHNNHNSDHNNTNGMHNLYKDNQFYRKSSKPPALPTTSLSSLSLQSLPSPTPSTSTSTSSSIRLKKFSNDSIKSFRNNRVSSIDTIINETNNNNNDDDNNNNDNNNNQKNNNNNNNNSVGIIDDININLNKFNNERFLINSSDDSSTTNGSTNDFIVNGVPIVDRNNVLQLFNNLEGTIQTMEETKCFEKYRIISDDLEYIKEQIQNLNDKNNYLLNEMNNKLNDEQKFINMIFDDTSSSRDIIQIESFNRKKINELKLELFKKDFNHYESELKELQLLCDQLHELYQQRDNVLNQIFEGNYGNEKEIQLEKELDFLMEERHYIEIAKILWINSDNLIIDALKYLDIGVEKIRQSYQIPENDYMFRYECLNESEKNFVLAHYNLISMHNNLNNVQLPHLKYDDIDYFENNIIIILFNNLNVDHFETIINSIKLLRKKMVTQHKWIKEVLNKTIKNDLLKIRDKCRTKAYEFRFERSMLIKQKQQQWNNDKNNNNNNNNSDDNINDDNKNNNNININKLNNNNNNDNKLINDSRFDLRVDSGVDSELDESAIVDDQYNNRILTSGEELGPMPSHKEIFGKISQIQQKHLREMQEFEQNQLLNKARMSQGLKEKLDVRRTRRNRIEMHKRQLEALQE